MASQLLNDCARQRFGETALGQSDGSGFAAPFLSGFILGDQCQTDLRTGPWVRGEILESLAFALACTA